MRERIGRWLDSPMAIPLASGCSLILGLFFTFVWSPLPWGWEGIDHYHDRALRLASGLPFDTTDVPWGYAYFLAAFYAAFGAKLWIPLIAQVVLNALVPLLLYHLVSPLTDRRIGTLSALLAGVLSFNTVYASTQSTDSVATVLFLGSLVAMASGYRGGGLSALVTSGLLAGIVPQFRPNLILMPVCLAAVFVLAKRMSPQSFRQMGTYLAVAALALSPWVVRNYQLMHVLLPTSTHGGVQFWYGTLQVGPFLESRADNSRTEFGEESFDYTSLIDSPLVVEVPRPTCRGERADSVTLTYWTDRNPAPSLAAASTPDADTMTFVVPAQPDPTAIYYYFAAKGPWSPTPMLAPPGGPARPLVFFVSSDHFGDLDRHDDLLDVFDLIRLLRYIAWQEQPANLSALNFDADLRVDDKDLRIVTDLLIRSMRRNDPDPMSDVEWDDSAVRLILNDGSELSVPRVWTNRVTDLRLRGDLVGALVHARQSRRDLASTARVVYECGRVEVASLNAVFYRRELHQMLRYTALGLDNINRDPAAYVTSAVYRALRIFLILGGDEPQRSQQFSGSRGVYATGFWVSLIYFVLFVAGVVLAWRRYPQMRLLLVPIVYIPVTLCFVLTNMRYTITVQPLMFSFMAVAMASALGLRPSPADTPAQLAEQADLGGREDQSE